MKENWTVIKEVPNYSVSNFGRIKNIDTGRILKATPNSDGYLQVSLYFGNGQYVKRTVHSLVAKAFYNKENEIFEVNHKDGIKPNNNVSNLEWMTHHDNMQHAKQNGLVKKSDIIRVIETNEIYESQNDCARALGLDQGAISACLRGLRNSHMGYTFEYVQL